MFTARGGDLTSAVGECARCGEDHEPIDFKAFERPVVDNDGTWTHWAPCPTNGDPILLMTKAAK